MDGFFGLDPGDLGRHEVFGEFFVGVEVAHGNGLVDWWIGGVVDWWSGGVVD
jgi:hypothetical protein